MKYPERQHDLETIRDAGFRGSSRAAWDWDYVRIVDPTAIAQVGITGDVYTNA